MVADIDWNLSKPMYESRGRRPLLEQVANRDCHLPGRTCREQSARKAHVNDPCKYRTLAEEVRGLATGARQDWLISYLQGRLAAIVASDVQVIGSRFPITEYGLDSLMALELRNRIQADLDLTVSLVRLLQGPTISELAQRIAADLPDSLPHAPRTARYCRRLLPVRCRCLTTVFPCRSDSEHSG